VRVVPLAAAPAVIVDFAASDMPVSSVSHREFIRLDVTK